MGNIGDTISQTIPAVGSSGPTYATNINAFLTEVKARLEAKVPRGSLASGDFDLTTSNLKNAGYLGLSNQGGAPTTPTATLQSFNNNLYWINSGGAVQITSGTTLNAAAIGGITGDYGGANPAQFRFVDTDQEYYAYDDFAGGAWARVWAKNFDLAAGATSANRVRFAYGGSTSYTATMPSALPSVVRTLSMDTSGNILAGDDTIRIAKFAGGLAIPNPTASGTFGNWPWGGGAFWVFSNTNIIACGIPITLQDGDIITSWKIYYNKTTSSSCIMNFQLAEGNATNGGSTNIGNSASDNTTNPGFTSKTVSTGTGLPYTITGADGKFLILSTTLSNTPATGDALWLLEISYKRR